MKKKYLFAAAGILGAVGGTAAYLYKKQKKEDPQKTLEKLIHDLSQKNGVMVIGQSKNTNRGKIILSRKIWRDQDTKITKMNNNFLLIGDDETVAEHFVIPNILERNSSYVVVDPEGKIYEQVKDNLELFGYDVKSVNLSSRARKGSVSYNPFVYAREEPESSLNTLTNCLLSQNEFNENAQNQFWHDLENLLLMSCMFHLLENGKKLSFLALYDLLRECSCAIKKHTRI